MARQTLSTLHIYGNMSFIGVKGAERLDANDPALGLIIAQEQAMEMLGQGTGMSEIKRATGWETGVDGKWRYEIADPFHASAEIEDHVKRHYGETLAIRYCLRDLSLLVAYPAFERLKLFALYSRTSKCAGYFNPTNYCMMVSMGTQSSPFEYQIEGILLHEVQHLIQEEENFARGGDASLGRRRYMRLAGEVEARNVCDRHSLSPEQRRAMLRSATQDIPDAEQIIVYK